MDAISFFYILLIFVGLVITQEIFYRYPRFSLWFFIVASIVLIPCWILLIGVEDWFAPAKVFSIASGIIVLSLFRTTSLGSSQLLQWTVLAFLVVNIFEAVAKDISTGGVPNYLNAIAGTLLILTLNKINTIHINEKEGYNDLHWSSITLSWIIGYTLWNWTFLYLNFGLQSALVHLAVLASAFVVVFWDKDRWLQARVFTLGTYFIVFHSFPHLSSGIVNSGYDAQLGFIAALISLGFMTIYTLNNIKSANKFL